MREAAPNRLPWPPMIFASLVLAAILAEEWQSLSFDAPLSLVLIGWALVGASIFLVLWAAVVMQRAKTTILPHRGSEALVVTGPFAISRNPIYLANSGVLIGAALAFGQPWLLGAALLDGLLVTHLAIKREEAHLAAKFGADWTAYSARVPRWFGPL